MTYKDMPVRSAMTAFAAVLAFTSTPLAAQQETTPPDPMTETPSNPPPPADPLAPEPAASEPAEREPAASAVEPSAPATTRRAPARSRTAATNRAPSQPVRAAPPATTAGEAPAEALPVAPLPATPMAQAPVAEPVPPATEPVPGFDDLLTEDALPYAGAAGLGLLALVGAGLFARRRRRREEMEHFRANQRYLDEHPAEPMPANPEPGFVRAAPPPAFAASGVALPEAEVRTDLPRTKLPSGFDLSRFGPHTRAAYMGPTPDNPSLSLKYRLRRAAAMDQRARLEGEAQPQAAQPARRPEPVRQQPAWATNDGGFMFRKVGGGRPSRSKVR